MHVFKIVVRPDPDSPDKRQGWARAWSKEAALALVDLPDASAFPRDCQWPEPPQASVYWLN